MSFTANNVVRQAAVRVNALVGATPSALDSTYTQAALLTAHFDSPDFPFDAFKDAFVLIEGQLANAIATVSQVTPGGRLIGTHPWRPYFHGVTASIAHEGAIPSITSASKPIIGTFGAVYDATDGTECTELAADDIRIAVRNANSWVLAPTYGYRFGGQRVYHTRTNVVIDCCFYDAVARKAAVIASLNVASILPDPLEEAMVCGMTSLFIRDDAFTGQAAVYRGYYQETLSMIGRGQVGVPQAAAA